MPLLTTQSAKSFGFGNLISISTGYVSIASTTLTSSSSSINFTSIPSTYKHLVIRCIARDDSSNYSNPIIMRFNGQTTTYRNQGLISNITGLGFVAYSAGANELYIQRAAGGSAPANYFGSGVINIMDYRASKGKTVLGEAGGALAQNSSNNYSVAPYGGTWQDSNAITSITITPHPSASNFVSGSRFSLYGIF